jgi:hypothetical protein
MSVAADFDRNCIPPLLLSGDCNPSEGQMMKALTAMVIGTMMMLAPAVGLAQTSSGAGGPTYQGSPSDLKSRSTIQSPSDDSNADKAGPASKTPPQTHNQPPSTTPVR